MNIGAVLINRIYGKSNDKASTQKICDNYISAYEKSSRGRDTVEISSEAYGLQAEELEMSATSGKDTLGITKGDKENTFVIHFYDSALISRAVKRGYITVNGRDILLSDEIKEKLLEVNDQAQIDRERAYTEYIMQYNGMVSEQQSRALKNEAKRMAQALAIASKIANGGKVSAEDEKFLMQYNPEMYAMAKSASIMAENKERQKMKRISEDRKTDGDVKNELQEGDTWSKCDWKYYETNMTVSMETTPEILGVVENEVILN